VTFRLLTYNIRRGGRGREEALAAVMTACAPDLVLLQEATHPATVQQLAEATGMRDCASRPGASVAFLSRRPVRAYRWHKPRWVRHAFLEVGLADGAPTIFGVHLSAVHSNWTERRRLIELRALLSYVQSGSTGLHLVTGDFNTLTSGEVFDLARLPPRLRVITWLTGRRIRWQTIHWMLQSGYTDAFRYLHHDDLGHTFPTWDPHLRLDYAFVPTQFRDGLRACEVVRHAAAEAASDHFPLLTELVV
jgi:exodeoxyribonuclease III